ncbi:MAG: hypothetical protein VX079_06865 [Pseudomonadota bacterium]|nr:hypothetical protein [Pseudomonadota bacterium]
MHVDHDQRRLVGLEAVEEMQAAAAVKDAVDDLLADLGSMHSAGKLQYLPGPRIAWRSARVPKDRGRPCRLREFETGYPSTELE